MASKQHILRLIDAGGEVRRAPLVDIMDRRTFLKTAAGAGAMTAAGGFATPAISQRAAARALRLVPHADVANFDPIWSSAYIARNAGLLVWDMLYGMDAKLQVQRQTAVDWGTVVARRAQKSPPSQGGWHIFHTSTYGVDCVDPTIKLLRADGDNAWFGWPSIPQVETEIAAWYDANTLNEEKAIARRLNKAALDNAIYAPLGWYLRHYAWRKNVSGIAQGPLPFFWGVNKTV